MDKTNSIYKFNHRKLLIKCISILFLYIIISPSFGQGKLTFQSIQQGLSNKYIRCILKDSYGFMWFGTYNGLVRFDGTNMVIYDHDQGNRNSLCHNLINAIVEDSDRNLWVATAEGVNLYDREMDHFLNIDSISGNKNYLNNKFITSIYCPADGKIWFGTMGNGINRYDRKNKQFDYLLINKTVTATENYITGFYKHYGYIWIGTRQGLYYIDSNKTTVESGGFIPINDNILGKDHVYYLSEDDKGRLLVTIQNKGLFCVENKNEGFTVFPYPLGKHIPEIKKTLTTFCNKDHTLWIGTENYGLIVIKDGRIYRYLAEEGNPQSISSNSIWSIYTDDTDKTWIGTFNKGICLVDRYYGKFEIYQRNILGKNTLADNDVTCFAADNKGTLWIGTDGGGITTFNLKTKEFGEIINSLSYPVHLSNDAIKTICRSEKNILWVGTWSGGIDRIDLNTKRVKNYQVISNGTGDNLLQCINEDLHNDLWAGTTGSGIFLYDKKTDRFVKPVFSEGSAVIPGNAYISCIKETSDSTIWIGSFYGLFALKRLNNGTYSCRSYFHNNDKLSVSSNRISFIYEDKSGQIWFGSFDNGINLLEKNKRGFRHILKKDGLSDNMVNGILEDEKGFLWISSNHGITRLNPANWSTLNYYKEDGLVSDVFYQGACYQTKTGELLFGSDNGFILFNPGNIAVNPYSPVMFLTDLRVNNKIVKAQNFGSPLKKEIGMADQIVLDHKQTSFAISYVGIGYTRPNCNNYEYKLEGFDTEWKQVGSQTTATYTNLNPGNYRFLVKGFNNDGIECRAPAVIQIKIKPPIWKTWWAYCFYLLTFSFLLYLFIRIRIERIKMSNSLQLERMAREKEHELNQSKTQFFTNISHELRTPLSLIVGPLESIMESAEISTGIKSRLITVFKNAKRLMLLVNELMDFRKMEENKISLSVKSINIVEFIREIADSFTEEAERRNINFIKTINCDLTEGWIDENKIEKVITNLLSNAFKYVSDRGIVEIVIEFNRENLPGTNSNLNPPQLIRITVSDNGRGIQEEDLPRIFDEFFKAKNSLESGTGIGLALSKNLIELHHGSIYVESIPDKITTFTVVFPVNRSAYSDNEIYKGDKDDINRKTTTFPDIQINEAFENTSKSDKSEILIVEDNDELRNYLTNELNPYYNVNSEVDGLKGLETAFEILPDLIITDVMMPALSGMEVCKKIKEDLRTSHIPVIMLTAKTSVDEQVQGLESGADVYITKPFSIRFLQTQIKQLITNRQLLYSKFSNEVHIIPGQYAKNKMDEEFLDKIINFIIENITDSQLGVEMIADRINLSRGQVYKKIKAITGQSAVEFVRNIRLKQAIKLMETRKHSLSEIAYLTGFASPSYFTRSFKEQYGKAPSDFLKE